MPLSGFAKCPIIWRATAKFHRGDRAGGKPLAQEKRERGKRSDQLNAPAGTKLRAAIEEAKITPAEGRAMINVARVARKRLLWIVRELLHSIAKL